MSDENITFFLNKRDELPKGGTEAIWKEYYPKVRAVIERKLRNTKTRDFDGEDVAQDAMKSLFFGLQEDKFDQLKNSEELWHLLVTIASRKITAYRRKANAQKRGGGATRGESVFLKPGMESGTGINEVSDENDVAETVDQLLETYRELLPEIGDEKTIETIMLRMQGYSNKEIAKQMQCSVSRIEQRISKVRKLWTTKSGAESEMTD